MEKRFDLRKKAEADLPMYTNEPKQRGKMAQMKTWDKEKGSGEVTCRLKIAGERDFEAEKKRGLIANRGGRGRGSSGVSR